MGIQSWPKKIKLNYVYTTVHQTAVIFHFSFGIFLQILYCRKPISVCLCARVVYTVWWLKKEGKSFETKDLPEQRAPPFPERVAKQQRQQQRGDRGESIG